MNDNKVSTVENTPINKSAAEIVAKIEGEGKFRTFKSPFVRVLWQIILAIIPIAGIMYVMGVHQYLNMIFYAEQYIGVFLGLILCAIYLSIPASRRSPKDKVPWYDWILAVVGLCVGLYIVVYFPSIIMKMGIVTIDRLIASVVAVFMILEAIRRVLGKEMFIIVIVFLSYGFFASYFPGIFKGTETPTDQLFNYLYLDPSSMISMLNIAATIALCFILFGQILLFFGGAEILNNFAISAFGKYRGGPAKAAIAGSSLVGTITGGPVVNVILTGTVTIPLMKKNGYSSAQAGAVEAVASTGGQIMPPVMGIAAFIIAEFLGVSYSTVALAALVPAVMYYVCLFFQVDFIAGREGFRRITDENIPRMKDVMRTGWVVLPSIVSLIYFLFIKGYSAPMSGIYASVVAIVFLAFQKTVREKMVKMFPMIFVETGKVMLDIGIVLAAAGFIVGITGVTGLGFKLGIMLAGVAEYGLFFLLLASAIVSVILGMGMPSVAAYTLVAVLVAPSLTMLGVDMLAAHLFVFYFAIVSNFTPPIALACFAAAPIAKESPHKIGFQAMRLGIIGYIVPFIFIYAPEMLLRANNIAPWWDITLTIVTALIACYLLAMALEGFLFLRLNAIKRILVVVLAAALFIPTSIWEYSWLINAIAFVLAVIFVVGEWQIYKKQGLRLGQGLEAPTIYKKEGRTH